MRKIFLVEDEEGNKCFKYGTREELLMFFKSVEQADLEMAGNEMSFGEFLTQIINMMDLDAESKNEHDFVGCHQELVNLVDETLTEQDEVLRGYILREITWKLAQRGGLHGLKYTAQGC